MQKNKKHGLLISFFVICLCHFSFANWPENLSIIGFDRIWQDSRFNWLSGNDSTIAIFDTGIDTEHVMFQGRNINGANFVTENLAPLADANTEYRDGHGHGSAVSGIAAGNVARLSDGTYVGGIAYGADIAAVRVLDNSGSGNFTSVINGMDWVVGQVNAGQNIRAINMSLGTQEVFAIEPSSAWIDDFKQRVTTLNELGVAIVAASGNGGSTEGISFPAIINDIIAVGSSTNDDEISGFSNITEDVSLLAPGEGIWAPYAKIYEDEPTNYVFTGSGTSFAAPQVAGSILLIHELAESLLGYYPTVEEILEIFLNSSQQINEYETSYMRLDIYNALDYTYAIYVPEPTTIAILSFGALLLLKRNYS